MMASIKSSLCLVALLVACDVIRGAPVQTPENEAKDTSVNSKVADVGTQERDIQDLMNLVKSQTKDRPVSVQRQVQTHVENINGQVTQVQEKEEKVIDTDKDKVVSDVKQRIQELPSGETGKPQVQVETKVDIPLAGVHETIENQEAAEDATSENDNTPEVQEAAEAVLDSDIGAMRQAVDASTDDMESVGGDLDEQEELTPADMAAFLYETQQLDAFYPALRKLVNESKMTADEAEAYAEEVVLQYQRLQLRDIELNAFAEKRAAMPLDFYAQQALPADGAVGLDSFAPQPMDAYGYNEGYPSPQEQYMIQLQMQQQQQQQQQEPSQQYVYNSELGFDPLDFLTVLYEAAYGKDNAEAREILRLLYERVSRDDNPDDLDQIRDLLIETVASSLSEDGQDRPIPWDIPPMVQSVPVNMPEFDVADNRGFDASAFFPPASATKAEEESLNADQVAEEENDNNGEDTAHNEEEEEEDLEAQLSNMNQQKTKRDDETANPVADNNSEESSSDKDDNSSDNADNKSVSDGKGEE